jgi:repressor LexA
MNDLTHTQRHVLEYFQQEIARSGRTPSLRKAAEALGVTHAAVSQHLKVLEARGYLKRERRYGRDLHFPGQGTMPRIGRRWREVPVVGRITAGLPMYAQQQWEEGIVVDASVFGGQTLFALRVQGDSMTGVGILDGDIAICEPRQYAEDGEIVVALIREEEATVKRFFRHADHIALHPENPAYGVMRYGFSEVLIQGKVVGIYRGPETMARLHGR